MKIHTHEIFKRNIQFILSISTLVFCMVTLIVCIKVLSRSSHPLIIGIDTNGTRVVIENTDPIYKTEAISFIQKFFYNAYNFNPQNFYKRLGYATTLMSDDLWKRKESEIKDLKLRVDRDQIELVSEIQKLSRDENGIYHSLIEIKEKNRLNEQTHKVIVSVKLKSVLRTHENPYGLEVDSYEETINHD